MGVCHGRNAALPPLRQAVGEGRDVRQQLVVGQPRSRAGAEVLDGDPGAQRRRFRQRGGVAAGVDGDLVLQPGQGTGQREDVGGWVVRVTVRISAGRLAGPAELDGASEPMWSAIRAICILGAPSRP